MPDASCPNCAKLTADLDAANKEIADYEGEQRDLKKRLAALREKLAEAERALKDLRGVYDEHVGATDCLRIRWQLQAELTALREKLEVAERDSSAGWKKFDDEREERIAIQIERDAALDREKGLTRANDTFARRIDACEAREKGLRVIVAEHASCHHEEGEAEGLDAGCSLYMELRAALAGGEGK